MESVRPTIKTVALVGLRAVTTGKAGIFSRKTVSFTRHRLKL